MKKILLTFTDKDVEDTYKESSYNQKVLNILLFYFVNYIYIQKNVSRLYLGVSMIVDCLMIIWWVKEQGGLEKQIPLSLCV